MVEALASGWRHALELVDHVRTLLDVRADRAAYEVRRKFIRAGVAGAVAVAAGTLLIASSLRVVAGLAGGLSGLFGGRAWLGDLAAGVLLLAALAAAGAAYLARREKKELREHAEKYARQRREHRARHS